MTVMAKVKSLKHGKKEFKPTGKRGRLIVRNLPFKCSEDDLHELFKPFGEVKDVQLLRRPNKKPVGCGFVEFTSRLDADRAVRTLNGSLLLGRPLYMERAVARDKYAETERTREETGETNDNKLEAKEECVSESDEPPAIKEETQHTGSNDLSKMNRIQNKSTQKEDKNVKKSRLVVRNLSFKTTDEKMVEHFSQYGEVTEVKLLRKPDNTLVGCGFVQFAKKTSAAKAICHSSGKPFLGRPIIVDWAIPKDSFKKMQEESMNKEIKKEDLSVGENDINATLESDLVKTEQHSDDGGESEEESEQSTSEDDDEGAEESDHSVKKEQDEIRHIKRKEDVDEGKTVFVKNLPFSADDNEFRECMEKFGPVFYALICKDKLTERSKCSGFVKFKNKEDAEKCLSAGTELKLNLNILDPHPALKRAEAEKMKEKTKEKKDNRNLYLVKEGLIVAGTPAARGVSIPDMEKRLQLEQWKTTKLRNLNMFVSNNRLVVHNLPPSLSDTQLRRLFLKHAGSKAHIKEAKIMRDLKHVDDKGQGMSKGYGFVSFEKHDDALTALRKINNNPTIFTPVARPIVAFSIENRAILNIKMKRLERSRQKNPLSKDYKPDEEEEVPAKKSRFEKEENYKGQYEPEYAGLVAKPGGLKMRKKHKLQNQAIQHKQDVKKQKHEMKMSRKVRRLEHIKKKKVDKQNVRTNKNKQTGDKDVAFNSLVDKYKTKILLQSISKKKWYDE